MKKEIIKRTKKKRVPLAVYLKKVRFSQAALASAMGVHDNLISRYRTGARWPAARQLGMLEGFTKGRIDWYSLVENHAAFKAGVEEGKELRNEALKDGWEA